MRLTRQFPRLPPVLLGIHLNKRASQLRKILAPCAERRHRDLHHVKPVEQIVAKRAALDRILQIGVRQSDQPRINFDRFPSAQPFKFAMLDHSQQLCLRVQRKMGDLIEHQRAAISGFEATGLGLCRSRKCAALVTEQLGLEQIGR